MMTSDSLKSPTEMPHCGKGEQQDSATIKMLHHKKVTMLPSTADPYPDCTVNTDRVGWCSSIQPFLLSSFWTKDAQMMKTLLFASTGKRLWPERVKAGSRVYCSMPEATIEEGLQGTQEHPHETGGHPQSS
ncbi:hypothetical protein STEG23_006911 [Scotinomys teguina]